MARHYDERILICGDADDGGNTLAHVAAYKGDPELFKVLSLHRKVLLSVCIICRMYLWLVHKLSCV